MIRQMRVASRKGESVTICEHPGRQTAEFRHTVSGSCMARKRVNGLGGNPKRSVANNRPFEVHPTEALVRLLLSM